MVKDLRHRAAFESMGETMVRVRAQQDDEVGREARALLEERQAARDAESAAKRDAREEETLSIARKALSNSERATANSERATVNARWANIIAISAIIFSTIMAILAYSK